MQPGDIVQLLSGGPPMVISGWHKDPFGGEDGWLCVWQIQGAVRRDTFPETILRLCAGEAQPAAL